MNINEIIARAESLRKETALNSIDPERVGSIMSDTLKWLNEFQLTSNSLGLDKIYSSVDEMNSDAAPVSDLTGKPLKAGQLAVIVAFGDEDEDNGKVYRFDNPGWTYVSIIGNLNIVQETGDSEVAVISQKGVTDLVSEYNVSRLFPTEGIDATNRYTFDKAVEKIPENVWHDGLKCSFINTRGQEEIYEYNKELNGWFPFVQYFINGKIYEGEGIIAANGNKTSSDNFSYIEFSVTEGVEYSGYVPFQNGILGLAFYDESDAYISGIPYSISSEYKNLPLCKIAFTAPKDARVIKATVFNAENRKVSGHVSWFFPNTISHNTIVLNGIAPNPEGAAIKNIGDVYFNTELKKFRKRVTQETFVDIEVSNEDIIIYNELRYNGYSDFIKGVSINSSGVSAYSSLPFTDGGVINFQNGNIETRGVTKSSCCEGYIPCYKASSIDLTVSTSQNADTIAGLAFYDKDFQYISGVQRPFAFIETSYAITVIPPAEAVYCRTSYCSSDRINELGAFSFKVNYAPQSIYRRKYDYRDIVDGVGVIVDKSQYPAINIMGGVYETTTLGASSYIDCKGALYMDITMPILTTSPSQGLVFYDDEGAPLNGILRPRGEAEGVVKIRVYIPHGATFFKTTFWNFEKSLSLGNFECSIYFIGQPQKYRPYQKELIFFSERVNQSVNDYWEKDNEVISPIEYKSTTGVLLLPDTYNPNGSPCPIIMYCHGFSHGVWYGTWGSTENFLLQKKKWASMGFAVFDCNGARNNNRQVNFTGAGSLQFVGAYKKCYDYILEHYNVEGKICVIAGSAGGPTGINFCYAYPGIVKKCALLSAWTDLQVCSWGQNVRDTFVEYLGFENTSEYEEDKTIGYDPAKRIAEISDTEVCNFPVSIKAWIGSLESGSLLYAPLYRFINALRSAGNLAYIREIENLSHTEVVSGNNDVVDIEVASWFL